MVAPLSRRALLAAPALLLAGPAHAAWPDRPLRLVHGFGAGGNPDTIGRIVAARLAELLGQPCVVEPRPGASGIPASELVARSAPDGHVLVILTGGHPVSAALSNRLPFHPVQDFAFISLFTEFPLLAVTRPDHPAADLRAMLALTRQQARPLFIASGAGRATTQGLSAELVGQISGAEVQHVAYPSMAGAHADLLTGRLDLILDTPITLLAQLREGRMRALAVSSTTPYPPLPGVPTMQQAGLPGYDVTSWLGLAGPAGLPAEIIARLNAACATVLAEPEPRTRLEALGNVVRPSTPAAFRDRVAADVAKWSAVVARAGIERG